MLKKMKKRVFFIVLSMFVLAGVDRIYGMDVETQEQDEYIQMNLEEGGKARGTELSSGQWKYTVDSSMHATITAYTGSSASIEIPDELGGYAVKYIGQGVFQDNKRLTSVKIPGSVTEIGNCAFKNCVNLSSLTINATGLKDLSSSFSASYCENYAAFYNTGTNTQGITVVFGSGVTRIPSYLFATGKEKSDNIYCHIKTVKMSSSVTEVGESAFENCYDIENVTWGTSLKKIGASSFENCEKIGNVTIPASATQVGGCAFKNCVGLSNLTINATSLEDISSYSAENYCESYSVFYNTGTNTQGITVTFGEGVKRIPSFLFATGKGKSENVYCHIKTVKMSSTITEIGESTFENCYDIDNVTWGTSLREIGASSFENCEKIGNVTIPTATTQIGRCAFKNCVGLSNLTIHAVSLTDESVYSALENDSERYSVFYNTGTNTQGMIVTFGSGVKRIPSFLFVTGKGKSENVYCHIKTVKMSSTITEIGESAFENCYDIDNVVWGTNLKEIGVSSFENCEKIGNVTIPATTTQIGRCAFKNCIGLSNLIIHAVSLEDISSYSASGNDTERYSVFYNTGTATGGMSVTFGNGVKRVPAYLFATGKGKEYNTFCNITSVAIPSTVQSIGDCAFYNCYNLSKAECPSLIATVGDEILSGCPNVILYAYETSPIAQYARENNITCVYYDMGSTETPEIPETPGASEAGKITLTDNNVQLSRTSVTYNGKVQTPPVVVRDNGGSLVESVNYTATYANNKNVGKAIVTLVFKGNYQGTVKKTFNIIPKGTAITKVTAGKKRISVKWKKQRTQVTGYEIQYSTSSQFKGAKRIKNIKAKTTSKRISKLKGKKRYYVRIRTYKKVKGKKYYSDWSKSRSVKTKR